MTSPYPSSIAAPALAPAIGTMHVAPREMLDHLQAAGFRWVQLNAAHRDLRPRDLGDSARRDLVATLRRRELAAAGLDLWIPPAHFAGAGDASGHVQRAVESVCAAIELAETLGRCPVCVTLPDDGDELAHVLEAITSRAERCGVAIADHAVPVRPRPGVSVGVDPAAWLARDADPAEAVVTTSASLVTARLVDLLASGTRAPIGNDTGDGRLDVDAYRSAVTGAGLASVVVDTRQWPDPRAGLARTREVWESGP